ncbi:MAG: hypothetical protein R6X05_04605, partial [Desulfobacterales bacterium]
MVVERSPNHQGVIRPPGPFSTHCSRSPEARAIGPMRFNRPPQLIRHPRSATCFLGIYFFKFQYFVIHTINFHFKKAVKFSVCPLTARCARDAEWGTLRKQDLYTHLHKFFFDHIAFFFQKARGSGYKYPSRIQPAHADSPETIK